MLILSEPIKKDKPTEVLPKNQVTTTKQSSGTSRADGRDDMGGDFNEDEYSGEIDINALDVDDGASSSMHS